MRTIKSKKESDKMEKLLERIQKREGLPAGVLQVLASTKRAAIARTQTLYQEPKVRYIECQ